MWHKGRLLGFGLTKEIVKGEFVVVPDPDSKFRRKFCFNFIQTPKMLLQKKKHGETHTSTIEATC